MKLKIFRIIFFVVIYTTMNAKASGPKTFTYCGTAIDSSSDDMFGGGDLVRFTPTEEINGHQNMSLISDNSPQVDTWLNHFKSNKDKMFRVCVKSNKRVLDVRDGMIHGPALLIKEISNWATED